MHKQTIHLARVEIKRVCSLLLSRRDEPFASPFKSMGLSLMLHRLRSSRRFQFYFLSSKINRKGQWRLTENGAVGSEAEIIFFGKAKRTFSGASTYVKLNVLHNEDENRLTLKRKEFGDMLH